MSDQRLELLEVYLHVVTLTQVVEEVREIRLKHPLTQEEPASQFTMQICLEETKGYVMYVYYHMIHFSAFHDIALKLCVSQKIWYRSCNLR